MAASVKVGAVNELSKDVQQLLRLWARWKHVVGMADPGNASRPVVVVLALNP